MEVTDPTTGLGVTVRMRRDLPGYNVTRARRSPRLRWSLPVDIQWQSECIMKYLGQNCACCDLLDPAKGKDDLTTKTTLARSAGGAGHDTVFVDSQTNVSKSKSGGSGEKATKNVDRNLSEQSSSQTTTVHETMTSVTSQNVANDDVSQRLSPLALDSFPGFPLPPPMAGQRRVRRRKQLISTSDMLVPKMEVPEAEVTKRLSPFDVMQSHLAAAAVITESDDVTMQQAEMIPHTSLPDIAEEESAGSKSDQKESS